MIIFLMKVEILTNDHFWHLSGHLKYIFLTIRCYFQSLLLHYCVSIHGHYVTIGTQYQI